MSGPMRLVRRLPTILRTLRWMKPAQVRAQFQHAIHGIAAPTRLGGAPPTLAITSSAVEFLPPPAHVRGLTADRIKLLSTPFDLGEQTDWSTAEHGPLFAYHLHQHEYLRTGAFDPPARRDRILAWIDQHSQGVGWDPHPISLRLLCWGKMLTTAGVLDLDTSERELMLSSMADQAETLSRGLEIRLQANHLLSNLLAVVWAGMMLEGATSSDWRDRTSMLIDEIEGQVHPDGGHIERSPMYHSLLLENLLDLLNLCRADPARAPIGLVDVLEAAARRMLDALRVWTHPDGDIALFADSGFDASAKPATIADYATRLGVISPVERSEVYASPQGSSVLPQSGYVRLEAPAAVLIASTSGPAPAHQPGHAHCDALAFELSLAGHRVVTDTGLYEYRPGSRRDRARTTAAHSTLQIDGEEQSEVWAAHRVGGRPVVELLGWDGGAQAEATCRGWSRPRTLHRRTYRVEAGIATIIDAVEGPCQRVRFCLPFDPAWRVELDSTTPTATAIRSADGLAEGSPTGQDVSSIAIDLPEEFVWRLEIGPYYPAFGRQIDRQLLVGEASGPIRSTLRIRWIRDE